MVAVVEVAPAHIYWWWWPLLPLLLVVVLVTPAPLGGGGGCPCSFGGGGCRCYALFVAGWLLLVLPLIIAGLVVVVLASFGSWWLPLPLFGVVVVGYPCPLVVVVPSVAAVFPISLVACCGACCRTCVCVLFVTDCSTSQSHSFPEGVTDSYHLLTFLSHPLPLWLAVCLEPLLQHTACLHKH